MTDHLTIARAVEVGGPGPWWLAHDFPERRPDSYIVLDWTCDGCLLAMSIAARRDPGRSVQHVDVPGADPGRPLTLATAFDAAIRWRLEHGGAPAWFGATPSSRLS